MAAVERKIRYAQAQAEAIRQEMERDPTIIIMGEDIAGGAGRAHLGIIDAWGGPFRSTKGLIKEFGPERVRDTPISEAGYIGAGIGAAMAGLRPIVELMFIDLLGVSMDQIVGNAAKIGYMTGGKVQLPITIMTRFGAGARSGAQHSEAFYSIFTHIPGLKVVVPSDAYTTKGLLISAIRDNDPVVVCDNRRLLNQSGVVPEEPYTLPLGRARIMQEGTDVTLVGICAMTGVCLEAAQALQKDGTKAEVLDLLSLSPLDEESILQSVKKTSRIVIVDEDTPRCGVAADIAALVAEKAFDYLDAPPKIVTSPHTPVPFSGVLEDLYAPNASRVTATVRSLLR